MAAEAAAWRTQLRRQRQRVGKRGGQCGIGGGSVASVEAAAGAAAVAVRRAARRRRGRGGMYFRLAMY